MQATGVSVFPHALRIASFLAVSDQPLVFDPVLWRQILVNYKIDGKPVFDLAIERDRRRLEEVLALPDGAEGRRTASGVLVETRPSLVHRLQGIRTITDNNMGTEWN